MTLQELYKEIDGDYEQATKVLRIDKLIDKHIRRFPSNTIFNNLEEAENKKDGNAIFESAHAIKGVCSNLGLVKCANMASILSEEFRNGNSRKMNDNEVKVIVGNVLAYYNKAKVVIKKYESENPLS